MMRVKIFRFGRNWQSNSLKLRKFFQKIEGLESVGVFDEGAGLRDGFPASSVEFFLEKFFIGREGVFFYRDKVPDVVVVLTGDFDNAFDFGDG